MVSLTPYQDAMLIALGDEPPDDPRIARIHRVLKPAMLELARMGDEGQDRCAQVAMIIETVSSLISSASMTFANGDVEMAGKVANYLLKSTVDCIEASPKIVRNSSFVEVKGGRA